MCPLQPEAHVIPCPTPCHPSELMSCPVWMANWFLNVSGCGGIPTEMVPNWRRNGAELSPKLCHRTTGPSRDQIGDMSPN